MGTLGPGPSTVYRPMLGIITPQTPHISARQMRCAGRMVGFARNICAYGNMHYPGMHLHLTGTRYY